MKIGAKRLYHFEDRRLNEQIDDIIRHLNVWVNFPRRGLDAIFLERFIKEEIITDKSINRKAEILQTKISNKIRHLDVDKVDGLDAEDLLHQFLVVASENISRFDIITITGYKADHTIPEHRTRIGGIAINDIEAGFSGYCQKCGLFKMDTRFDKGSNLWLGTSGKMTNIPPSTGFSLYCGKVVDTGLVLIDIGDPIRL